MKKSAAAALLVILLSIMFPASAEISSVMKLPFSLKSISDEAFCGCTSISRVEVSEGTAVIGSKAFAHSTLREIALPSSIRLIADDAFEGCVALCIEAEGDSYAYHWAQSQGYTVRDITASDDDELPWVPA